MDIPEVIETKRLKLQVLKAGFGKKLHEAIIEGYEDYVKGLNWPKDLPNEQSVEGDCPSIMENLF